MDARPLPTGVFGFERVFQSGGHRRIAGVGDDYIRMNKYHSHNLDVIRLTGACEGEQCQAGDLVVSIHPTEIETGPAYDVDIKQRGAQTGIHFTFEQVEGGPKLDEQTWDSPGIKRVELTRDPFTHFTMLAAYPDGSNRPLAITNL